MAESDNVFEDLSGVSDDKSDNPYASLLKICNDDQVSWHYTGRSTRVIFNSPRPIYKRDIIYIETLAMSSKRQEY